MNRKYLALVSYDAAERDSVVTNIIYRIPWDGILYIDVYLDMEYQGSFTNSQSNVDRYLDYAESHGITNYHVERDVYAVNKFLMTMELIK